MVVIPSEPRVALEIDREPVVMPGRTLRFKVRKPRLPWTYTPRSRERRLYTNCDHKRIYHDLYSDAQGLAAAIRKACGPRRARRTFDPGGPEAGTLSEARRAPGLFDENWDRQFPLTRKERELLEQGKPVPDPFFAPPTTPAPENWIDDKLRRLRGTFGPTKYQTPKGMLPFCPEGGFALSCAGPDGGVAWVGGERPLTALEVARFTEAYCAPGQCQTGGKLTPPAGFKELVQKSTPRNPAVRLKASCRAVLAPDAVITDVPLGPLGAPPEGPPPPHGGITVGCPAGWYWAIGLTGVGCADPRLGRPPATQAQVIAIIGQAVWDQLVARGIQGQFR